MAETLGLQAHHFKTSVFFWYGKQKICACDTTQNPENLLCLIKLTKLPLSMMV